MKFFSYLRVELNRIFHSKFVYLIMVLTMICPMAGYKLQMTLSFGTSSSDLIGNPSMAGALGGGVLFAILTLLEFDRVRKHQTEALTNSIVSPLVLNVVRLISIGIVAIISVSITSVLYFPYTFMKMGNIFDAYTYWNSFFLLMLPSVLLSILVISAFYQIFGRADISMITFIAFMLTGFSKWFDSNNILHWINPIINSFSDYFGNGIVFRLMQHNRLFWFLVLGGLWVIGLLCVRRYGKGLFKSILYNSRKVYIPLLAIALISSGVYAYINQPNIALESKFDDSDEINEQLELLNTDLEISFDTSRGRVSGKTTYFIKNLSSGEQECKLKMNSGYTVHHITANGKEIAFRNSNNKKNSITFTVPNDPEIKINLEYDGTPKIQEKDGDLLWVMCNMSNKGIDFSFGSYIYPQLRVSLNKDESPITGRFTIPSELIPIVYGEQIQEDDGEDKPIRNVGGNTVKILSEDGKNKTWSFRVNGKGFFTIMAGDYVVKKLGDESMPIEFYYSCKIEENMKDMSAEKVMGDTIEYCTSNYGKLHNISENNPCKIAQRTTFVGGGLGLPNLSTIPESSFSDKNLNDKSNGATKAEVLAHELAHQWWGLPTIDEGGNNENWSAEGFAVYTTYRVVKETRGEEYAQKNYVDIWKKGSKEQDNNFYNRHPKYLKILPEKYADEIDGCNRVTRLYEKMPLQILKAAEIVGGEDKMDKILAKLYEKSEETKITWQDFLDACGLKEEDLNIE
ncbi:M1 family aminopeptidase [Clostridium sp. ZBS4]|uniref:M1 family aminopeptidase n=1 Tax=Clostridium sp. ZBS4 TaxID=2949974 RepID=UPI0020798768|nr:M1 family aminopeptidase [Clostridium sp. ZBS4]